MDLPTQRSQLGEHRIADRRHGTCLDRFQVGRDRRAGPPARPVARRRARVGRYARDALPARRPLQRGRLRTAHAPDARTGLLRARDRLPRLRQEFFGSPFGGHGARMRAPPGPGWPRGIRRNTATSSATRSAARSASTWLPASATRAASSSRAPSPPSPMSRAVSNGAGCPSARSSPSVSRPSPRSRASDRRCWSSTVPPTA